MGLESSMAPAAGCCLRRLVVYLAVLLVPASTDWSASGSELNKSRLFDVCKWEAFEGDCPPGTVILIDHAHYGRMRLGSCLTTGYGHVGCYADVQMNVERRCSGRQQCRIGLPDVDLDKSPHNCPTELLAYLEVSYHCQPVIMPDDENCTADGPLIMSPSGGGYLASLVTQQTGHGSPTCPWLVRATSDQTITATLLDFGVRGGPSAAEVAEVCVIYAEIKEAGSTDEQRAVLVCGGEKREKIVYSSKVTGTTELQVSIHTVAPSNSSVYFLIRFEVGCSEYKLPANTVQVGPAVSNTIRIHCADDNRTVWDVVCVDGRWNPDSNPVDCTNPRRTALYGDSPPVVRESSQTPANQGVLIVIVIGTALLLSIVIIVTGIIYLRRRSRCEVSMIDSDPYGKYAFPIDSSSLYASVHVGRGDSSNFYPTLLASHDRLSCVTERDYATTLQMRQQSSATPVPSCSGIAVDQHGSLWTTCPVHGPVARVASHPGHHRFGSGGCRPLRPGAPDRLYEVTTRLEPVDEMVGGCVGPVPPTPPSPFYHELDPSAVDDVTARCQPTVAPPSTADGERVDGSELATCRSPSSPLPPLTQI